MLTQILKFLFGDKTAETEHNQLMIVDGKLVTVVYRDDYLYTKDRYGNLKPMIDDLGRHVRRSIM